MAEKERINFLASEEDSKLIAESIAFHGGEGPDALRRGLRAGQREIDVLKSIQSEARKAAASAKGKGSAARKR